ncbi:hypothetical protein ACVME8_007696 [Bradyrhizobium diazoefficiens]
MTTFTKSEVAADWDAPVMALAKSDGMSKEEATLKLSMAPEGTDLYNRYQTARPDVPIAPKERPASNAEQQVATMK